MKFYNFMSHDGTFDSLLCPEGRIFVHNDCPGEGFSSLQVVSRGAWFWMKLIPALPWVLNSRGNNFKLKMRLKFSQ